MFYAICFMPMKCVFCKIVKKEIPAAIVLEDDEIMAFKDVRPLAPVHILIIPKKHIESVNDFRKDDVQMIGRMIIAAKMLASDLDISEKGYKLTISGRRVGRPGSSARPSPSYRRRAAS